MYFLYFSSVLLQVSSKNGWKFDYELIDVSGQRTDRRKWIHYFGDVAAGEEKIKRAWNCFPTILLLTTC